jgi:DICT domain-containing protein
LPSASRAHCSAIRRGRSRHALTNSPVSLVHTRRDLRLGRKDILLRVTRALEAQALELGEHAVVAACFQDIRHFTPTRSRARYEQLAARTSLTVVLGTGMPDSPGAAIRGANLLPDDELVGEWDIAVLGPHYAGALVARDLGDTGPDHERRFEFVLTFERQLVIEAAALLIARLNGSPRPVAALAA